MHSKSTRECIIEAADQLFYKKGFEHTSFADIADAVNISRGNFYHHFKAKDEILTAVIEQRMSCTQKMLDQWDAEGKSPVDRIRLFINILLTNWDNIKLYGCPVGTLSAELAKLNHASRDESNKIFSLFRSWLTKQFVALGHKKDAEELAMHILARSQGVATISGAFRDRDFVKQEIKYMDDWLTQLTKSINKSGRTADRN